MLQCHQIALIQLFARWMCRHQHMNKFRSIEESISLFYKTLHTPQSTYILLLDKSVHNLLHVKSAKHM